MLMHIMWVVYGGDNDIKNYMPMYNCDMYMSRLGFNAARVFPRLVGISKNVFVVWNNHFLDS